MSLGDPQQRLFDEIGPWSEIKLDIIRKYASAYARILSRQRGFSFFYVDAFAGAGRHVSRMTGELVAGSPDIALRTDPPFQRYFFIDIDRAKVDYLEQLARANPSVQILKGDANVELVSRVLPQ